MADEPITELLDAWKRGDRSVEAALVAQVYPVLREIAGAHARRHGGMLTLGPTELVHEAYERLHRQRGRDWHSRVHFFAVAANVVRSVAIDYLRQRGAEKRGGDLLFVPLDSVAGERLPAHGGAIDWLEFDQALTTLAATDADCARVVELRVFGGMTVEEVATVLGSSTATVGRQWRFARVWLADRIGFGRD